MERKNKDARKLGVAEVGLGAPPYASFHASLFFPPPSANYKKK